MRDLVSHRKSSYKWFRNRTKVLEASLGPATRARPKVGGAPGDANRQTAVLGEAVATDDAVDVPKHVGLCSCPRAHTGNPHPVTRVGGSPGPSYKDDANTHCFTTQDLLKEKGRSPPRGFTQKKPLLDQDYQDRESDF